MLMIESVRGFEYQIKRRLLKALFISGHLLAQLCCQGPCLLDKDKRTGGNVQKETRNLYWHQTQCAFDFHRNTECSLE